MEDDLEQNARTDATPIKLLCIPCRLRQPTLQVTELVRFACLVITTECIVALMVLHFVVSDASSELVLQSKRIGHVNLRILPALCLVPLSVQYAVCWLNLAAGGWGAPDSRFWCDVKIMYVRGFNTVRTLSRMCTSALLFGAFAIAILHVTDLLILCFLCPLAALAEWQAGLVELQNQYDVKLDDKFADDQGLCLETLHHCQQQRARSVKTWAPYILSVGTKVYITTWFVYCASIVTTPWPLFGPLAVAIVLYLDILPFVLMYVYQRNELTFCELELYRIVADCVLPCSICFIVYGM